VSPLHTSRREARTVCARAVAAVAVVCAVPVVLAALTVGGPLASAASSEAPPPDEATPPPATGEAVPAEPVTAPPPTTVEEAATPPAPQPLETRAPPPEPPPASAEVPPAAPPGPPPAPAEEPPAAEEPPVPPPQPAPGPAREPPAREVPVDDAPAPGPSEQVRRPREAAPWRGVGPAPEGPVEERGRDEERELPEDLEPDDEPAPDEERAPDGDADVAEDPPPDEQPGADYWRSDPSGWRFWRGVPNLTGAIGGVGGGGKEEGSVAPILSSVVPPIVAALLEPPVIDQPPPAVQAQPPAAALPATEALPTPAPPPQSLFRGSPPSEVAEPIGDGGTTGGAGGTSGTGGTTGTAAPASAGGAGAGGGAAAAAPILADADFNEPVGQAEGGGDGSANPEDLIDRGDRNGGGDEQPPITRTVERIVEKVPNSLKYALAALGALSLMLGAAYLFAALRARSLARQRRDLLQEVGLLQSALLPPVPEKVGGLRTSVAYRPADGPGAGGDFYDVLPLTGGGVGFILGDVSGHGRGALARTAFMRYTLRAYLEAGLEPRAALKVAGRVIDENLGGDFATVLLAVHDPETGSLTYATAGHPAPIVVGPQVHHPVTAGSSPPIGVGVPTGLRQTTVPLVSGSVACLFTDGLMEARSEGGILGRDRLERMLAEMGDEATARGLIDRVAQDARVLSDDIAAVVVSPVDGVTSVAQRTEQIELTARELDGPIAGRFLGACGFSDREVASAIARARALTGSDGAVLHVVFGERPQVEVLPRSVEGIEAASHRTASAR
jgi:stage II sporulation SpoE-like protein